MANEVVDEKRHSGEEGIVFKIDFEKAYNHVKCDFFFLIRNEEDYINIRTNTGEKKEKIEREKNQGKDERSFLHKLTKEKTPNNRTLKTKRNPINLQTFETQTPIQLSCRMLRGTPLKASVQEAHREE